MKKINGPKVYCILSVLLFLGFIIKTIIDYTQYSNSLHSAPFYYWVITNLISFIIPAIIVFIVGFVIRNKTQKDK